MIDQSRRARGFFERGQARWPALALPFESFFECVRPHFSELDGVADEQVCAEDLYLVAACIARLPGAVEALDAMVWPSLEKHLRRMEKDPGRLAEMRQVLMVRLFVPDVPGAAARVHQYTGRWSLRVWLRVTAARLALNARRAAATNQTTALTESAENAAQIRSDIELSFIRGRYEADFVAALRDAMAALDDEQRLLLRFRYHEELTSDQIAVVLKTSRVTAHRRVVAARETLAEKLREKLRARLSLSESGLKTLLGLLSSKLVPALTAELRAGLT